MQSHVINEILPSKNLSVEEITRMLGGTLRSLRFHVNVFNSKAAVGSVIDMDQDQEELAAVVQNLKDHGIIPGHTYQSSVVGDRYPGMAGLYFPGNIALPPLDRSQYEWLIAEGYSIGYRCAPVAP